MEQILLIIQVIVCILLVLLVLVQQGKGATMGAAFGSGASQTVFGSQGSGSFLMKLTAVIAFIFFANSLALGYLAVEASKARKHQSILQMPVQQGTPQKTNTMQTVSVPTVDAKNKTSVQHKNQNAKTTEVKNSKSNQK